MKYILITGVSSGIGLESVRFLIDKGYYIFGSVRKEEDKAKLESTFPRNFTCLKFDIAQKDQVAKAFDQVKILLNGNHLFGLVNNAGLSVGGPMNLLPDDKFRQQIEVNLFGVRNVTNVFLPLLGGTKGFQGQPGKS
jgi:NAD(P)-dependent dehydrogenase (short-subunit alcohol dehydrogenase family)